MKLVLETDFCTTHDVKCVSCCGSWSRKFGNHQPRWQGSETLSFLAQGKEGNGKREWVEAGMLTMSPSGLFWRAVKTALDSGKETFGIFLP